MVRRKKLLLRDKIKCFAMLTNKNDKKVTGL